VDAIVSAFADYSGDLQRLDDQPGAKSQEENYITFPKPNT